MPVRPHFPLEGIEHILFDFYYIHHLSPHFGASDLAITCEVLSLLWNRVKQLRILESSMCFLRRLWL